jgi:lambda family phage portal protein
MAANPSMIVDVNGRPFPGRFRADGGGALPGMPMYQFAYDAANWSSQQMGNWLPWVRSPDSEINLTRDRVVARSRDLVRNDGWSSGGILRILDNTVGTNLRLSASPDHRALKARFGGAFDATWADEFRRTAEALWRGFSENLGRWNDVERQLTVGQQFRLSMRHKLIDGECLALMYWMPERVGYGGADYATCVRLVDPDRLSNPWLRMDSRELRGGIEIDPETGVRLAAHIRRAEPYDWYNAIEANTWERVPFEDPEDGWLRVIHDFDRDRVGQHRGMTVFAPIIAHAKMLARYYNIELQQAALSAAFGVYVTSPYDRAQVEEAIGAGDEADMELSAYQSLRGNWSQERGAYFDGAKVPTLFPGEDIKAVSSEHPHGNFSAFAQEMLRIEAAALGVSAEQMTQDWSKTNYSSARAALMESWKTLMRRRHDFTTGFASPIYASWLREAMERGELPLPAAAPDFVEAASAYARCRWLGPARGWVDPTKEPAGAVLRMEAGVSTLEAEAAEQGMDWEEVAQQRAIEQDTYDRLGVMPPKWAQPQPGSAFFQDDSEAQSQNTSEQAE